ncbi:hypothetical protein NQ015_01075 [Corynebacterium sp. 153RC1]|uniref:hypothetical protein n=1 Tax=unclassified Corynebacterium TaxID=2624378 RepID=UPI00211C08C7|nr:MULTISPECIES: hypothetical protein [unclassified Corynebacterium]MCQ9369647.1 hypothetical protein [Corynebacterium sp. 35RC1]MCQ9351507.1 hypothetical protein [Corynebacterium sp. 209RC1]MCQ9354636.1 hypothetical protein [Corynebacterium sp. 1222RC1]MCQ9357512.1 hypothetical protein [Corynebacterium sp. 122RC1]MCQ9358034.1 hypothetical protein [Corynebacterium sp. 142RC1]
MSTALLVLLAVLITAFLGWAWNTAQRLNRLHIRTDAALQALQAALDRRAALSAALIPSSAGQAAKAQAVQLRYATFAERGEREWPISQAIEDLGEKVPAALTDAEARLHLAVRFYNDAVADTRALRTRPLVRVMRLGGTASLPEYFELLSPASPSSPSSPS